MAQRLLLKDLKDLHVVVIHPPDKDGKTIIDQLNRIGCRSELVWPVGKALPSSADVVFAGLFFDSFDKLSSGLKRLEKAGATVIGVVDYENPAMLDILIKVNVSAVTSKPVRSFGILTNLVVARANKRLATDCQEKIQKLEKKLSEHKTITKAKSTLMEMHRISEDEAYRTIREQAMAKRTSIEEMAIAILNAKELLSVKPNSV